ncbi:MAG TPA: hypothetical protein VMM78_03020 [Thermomicrobiales bacterium]|nr:hypothetical protein [Thermomicrobiales bacterium]
MGHRTSNAGGVVAPHADGSDADVSEQWTISRSALVLTGSVADLAAIARRLGLPDGSVVETRHGQAALGLWGEALAAYQRLSHRAVQDHSGRGRTT